MSSCIRRRARREPVARRAVAALIAAGLLVGWAVGPGAATPAAPGDDRARRIAELEALLGDLSAEEAHTLAELGEVRERREALDAELAHLDAQIAASQAALDAASASFDRLTAQYLAMQTELDETEARLREARDRFVSVAVALYQSGGSASRAAGALLFEADDPMDMSAGAAYLARVAGDRREAVEELDALGRAVAELVEASDDQRRAAMAALAEAEEQRGLLAGLRAADEAREAQLLAQIRDRQADYEAELAALSATSNAITDLLYGRQHDQPRADAFTVLRPVPGAITSGFGLRVHPILGSTRMHNGVDMHADHGSSVRAGADGVVAWAGPRDGYGNTVIVDHGNQYATLYAHLSAYRVGAGDAVAAGDEVGLVGATGLATGPHLHFEVRLLGVPVDPLDHM